MQLLFEKSVENRRCALLPDCDVPQVSLPEKVARKKRLGLPELSEKDISRHYSGLERRTFGVNHGFYPLGSCTMKWNPRINETVASLPGFTEIHPLQPVDTIQGCLEVLYKSEQWFAEITGMDSMTFQPAAGAHGELTGLMLITGTFTRIAAVLGAVMMVAFIFGIVSVWVRGISIDCGCFAPGGAVDPSQTQYPLEVARDVGLFLLGAWTAWRPTSPFAVDAWLFAGDDSTTTEVADQEGPR